MGILNIIIDTREKTPWTFEKTTSSEDIVFQKLDTGDYSLEGLEDILCIERKKSVAEIANNITDKRFKRELERMSEFKYKFLILEFDYRHIDDFPEGSDIPKHFQKKVRVKGPFIIKCLSRIMCKYGISVIPCSSAAYAEHIAYSIMKEVYDASS
jgi:ERCC4-type nuclease